MRTYVFVVVVIFAISALCHLLMLVRPTGGRGDLVADCISYLALAAWGLVVLLK